MMVTTFCQKLKVAASDFSMIKNIVVLSFISIFAMKLICCLRSSFSNLICLVESTAISL